MGIQIQTFIAYISITETFAILSHITVEYHYLHLPMRPTVYEFSHPLDLSVKFESIF